MKAFEVEQQRMCKDMEAWKCMVCLEGCREVHGGQSRVWSWAARVGIPGPPQLCQLGQLI